jgi:hypothetical protein
MDVEPRIEDLDRRLPDLETVQNKTAKTLRWMATTLGRIAATQDQHTKDLAELRGDVTAIKADLSGLHCDLPVMLADAVREALREEK